jgi:hypothetical protein
MDISNFLAYCRTVNISLARSFFGVYLVDKLANFRMFLIILAALVDVG